MRRIILRSRLIILVMLQGNPLLTEEETLYLENFFFPFFTLKFCAETSPSSQLIKKRDIKKEVSFKWILIEERYFSNNRQNMFSPCISRSD